MTMLRRAIVLSAVVTLLLFDVGCAHHRKPKAAISGPVANAPAQPKPAANIPAPVPHVVNAVNWSQFLADQDLVWNSLPSTWESGAFIGNGELGAMIYQGNGGLEWDVGRSDVCDKGDRVAIGRFVVQPGSISRGTMRVDLWNAEARGTLDTPDGTIKWRSFTHAKDLVNVIELTEPAGADTKIVFQHLPPNPARAEYQNDTASSDKNPAEVNGDTGDIHWCQQNFKAGGGYVVAWAETNLAPGHRVFLFTVDYQAKGSPKPDKAVADVTAALGQKLDNLVASHRAWWHDYYPESFLSIPDARMQSFYWIQMYKLASATRADRTAIDLMGPWFRRTPWPHIWWNLNIQLTYWPVYAANRLEIGESLTRLIDADRQNFMNNVPDEWRSDSAGIGRSSPYNGVRGVGDASHSGERGDLTWVLHNYWLQYRFSGNEKLLQDGLYPILKPAIGYYLHLLSRGDDGKLHLPPSISPEYPAADGNGNASVRDANYDLSLLRWGLNTLLAINDRFNLGDPLTNKWTETLRDLAPNPVDENGYMVGSDQPFAVSHRHYSHLFSVYPLHLVDPQSPADRPLIEKSLDHWKSMPKAWRGYSFTGASAISSWLGRKDDAVDLLQQFLNKPKTVLPNTMYTEAGPVIETPLSGAASIHELVLQSWATNTFGTHIRVFPAVPDSWKDVSFDKLLAEGAFEVSAVRKDGKTQFVQVKSLAGNPCRVTTSLEGRIVAFGSRTFNLKEEMEDGRPVTVVDLKQGETVLLLSAQEVQVVDGVMHPKQISLAIKPVETAGIKNYYGSPKTENQQQ